MESNPLKIKIDSSEVIKASDNLNKLNNNSKGAENQTTRLKNGFFGLKSAIATLGIAAISTSFIKTADSMNLLNARLKLTSDSLEEYNSQQIKLLAISKDSYTSLSDTITLYTKLDPALSQLGATTEQVNSVVASFTKGLQLGGASANESSSAILQFSQAMGSGVLRGEEFNSMAEASPKLMQYLAKGLEVPQTALRKMAENGELTALRVSNALLKMKSDIDRDFVTLPVTVAKATTNAMTEIALGISDIDNAIGITKGLATAIGSLTNEIATYSQSVIEFYKESNLYIQEHQKGLNQVLGLVGGVSAAYLTFVAGGAVVAGIANITAAITAMRIALLSLQASVPVLGWIAAAVGVGAAVYISSLDDINEANAINIKTTEQAATALEDLARRRKLISEDKFMLDSDQKRAIDIIDSQILSIREQTLALRENKFERSNQSNELFPEDTYFMDKFKIPAKKEPTQIEDNKKPIRNEIELIKLAGSEYQKFNLTLDENIKKMLLAGATEKEVNDYRLKATKEFNEKQNKDSIQEAKKKNEDLLKLEKEHQENIKKVTQDAKDMITSDIQKLANDYIDMYAVVKDTLTPDELNKLNEAFQQRAEDITGVTELLKEAQEITTSEIDKINEKYMKMYEAAKNNPMFDDERMKLFYEKWQKAIEDTKEKMDFSKSIKLDTEGENREIAKISKGFDELNDASKQYQENKVKAGNDTEKLSKNEEQYRKDQVNGYANISSAMSDMFEKGSKEAAAFQAVSTALALVEATRAIVTQGTGDPYTAIPRMIAMAAMVGSLMKNIGVSLGMNKTSTSSDAFSAQTANTGTGTTLGDSKKASDSIINSLDTLQDFAKPQFRLATSMDKSLRSIDNKIGGLSSLFVQQGGYGFGEGFAASSSTKDIGKDLYNQVDTIIGKTTSFLGKDISGWVQNTVGTATGATLTSAIISGLFGKKSVSQGLTDSGITFANAYLKDAIKQLNGSAYQTISTTVKTKSWFSSKSSTSVASYFQALDSGLENQFSLVLKNLYDTVYESGLALGESSAQLTNNLNKFVVSIGKISLKGKTGEQIQELLSNVFSSIGDKLTTSSIAGLTPFQQVGEGMFETLARVATGMEQANYFTERLGSTFQKINFKDIIDKQGVVGFEALYQSILRVETQTNFREILSTLSGTAEELYGAYLSLDLIRDRLAFFGKGLDALSISIIQGAGGLESLSDSIGSYIENFYSDTEQQALKISELTQLLNRAGISTIPTSISGFRKLIESIDTSSESGQKLYGNLLSLSGAFSDVYSEIDSERTSLLERLQDAKATTDAEKLKIERQRELDSVVDNSNKLLLKQIYAQQDLNTANEKAKALQDEQTSNRTSLLDSITNYVKELRSSSSTLSIGTTFKTFASSFNTMIDAIKLGSSNLSEIGQTTLDNAKSYLDTVALTATSGRDLQFAKQVVANKLASVTSAPDITLGTINQTLKISFNENSVIVNELKAMREQLSFLNGLTTTSTATQLKTLSATRALIS